MTIHPAIVEGLWIIRHTNGQIVRGPDAMPLTFPTEQEARDFIQSEREE